MPPRKKTLQTPAILASIQFATTIRATDQSAEVLINAIVNTPDLASVVATDPSDIEGFVKAIAEVSAFPKTFSLSPDAIQVLLDLIDYAKQDETAGFVEKVASSPILEELLAGHLQDALQSVNAVALPGSLNDAEDHAEDHAEDDAEDEGEDDTPAEIPVIPVMDGVQSVQSNLI